MSLASAKRKAAEALSAKRVAEIARKARSHVSPQTKARVRAARLKARASQRAALARAKKISALARKADPSTCLKSDGSLAVSHVVNRAKARAGALRARQLILSCLHGAQDAQQQIALVSRSTGAVR